MPLLVLPLEPPHLPLALLEGSNLCRRHRLLLLLLLLAFCRPSACLPRLPRLLPLVLLQGCQVGRAAAQAAERLKAGVAAALQAPRRQRAWLSQPDATAAAHQPGHLGLAVPLEHAHNQGLLGVHQQDAAQAVAAGSQAAAAGQGGARQTRVVGSQ